MQSQHYNHSTHLVAIDCIIFGYEQSELKILLFRRKLDPSKGDWSLVGGWVDPEESVEDAALRVTYNITGLQNIYLEQIHVFSAPNRDPGGRVISVAFYALMRIDEHDHELVEKYGAQWFSLSDKPKLIFDHDIMVDKALDKMRLKASYELLGRELLPEKFTLLHLRQLYNAIFLREFDPGNFRKKILSLKALEKLQSKNKNESKKGAYYYKFKEDDTRLDVIPIVKI